MNAQDVARKALAAIPFRIDSSVLHARRTVDLAAALAEELAMLPAPERIIQMVEELMKSTEESRHAVSMLGQMYLHLAYFIEERDPVDGR